MNASYVPVTPKIPRPWVKSQQATHFFAGLTKAPGALLMLDYDGTLAPFTDDRLRAEPYTGVRERLEMLALTAGHNRVALVSGRRAQELQTLLALHHPIEIWGSHGREHLALDGTYTFQPLTQSEQKALDQIRTHLEREFDSAMLEQKPNSIAVHWRANASRRSEIEAKLARLLNEFSSIPPAEGKLRLLPFDGGVEVRAGEVHKGDAVKKMLHSMPGGVFTAFLGDDATDEDAFRILRNEDYADRSLSVLVRSEPRSSLAQAWLTPPEELLLFLDTWLQAVEKQTAAGTAIPLESAR